MSLKEIFRQQQRGVELMGNVGVIGLHMVSGPLVGFAIGYGLDYWLETGPWLKLVFLLIGIGAGFLNVYTDSRRLLRKMDDEAARSRAARQGQEAPAHTVHTAEAVHRPPAEGMTAPAGPDSPAAQAVPPERREPGA